MLGLLLGAGPSVLALLSRFGPTPVESLPLLAAALFGALFVGSIHDITFSLVRRERTVRLALLAFTAVLTAGVATLFPLGEWRYLLAPATALLLILAALRPEPRRAGLLAAGTNPKALLFFTAFLPQFIDPARNLPLQFAIMAGTFAGTEFLTEYVLASAAHRISPWLRRVGKRFNRVCGGLFVALGAALPLSN